MRTRCVGRTTEGYGVFEHTVQAGDRVAATATLVRSMVGGPEALVAAASA